VRHDPRQVEVFRPLSLTPAQAQPKQNTGVRRLRRDRPEQRSTSH
jgi:hypothetical protein